MCNLTVLEVLANNNIVSFNLSGDRKEIAIKEECDMHFVASLNKKGLSKLITELKEIETFMLPSEGEDIVITTSKVSTWRIEPDTSMLII